MGRPGKGRNDFPKNAGVIILTISGVRLLTKYLRKKVGVYCRIEINSITFAAAFKVRKRIDGA